MVSQNPDRLTKLGRDSDVTKPRFLIVYLKKTTNTGLSETVSYAAS